MQAPLHRQQSRSIPLSEQHLSRPSSRDYFYITTSWLHKIHQRRLLPLGTPSSLHIWEDARMALGSRRQDWSLQILQYLTTSRVTCTLLTLFPSLMGRLCSSRIKWMKFVLFLPGFPVYSLVSRLVGVWPRFDSSSRERGMHGKLGGRRLRERNDEVPFLWRSWLSWLGAGWN